METTLAIGRLTFVSFILQVSASGADDARLRTSQETRMLGEKQMMSSSRRRGLTRMHYTKKHARRRSKKHLNRSSKTDRAFSRATLELRVC